MPWRNNGGKQMESLIIGYIFTILVFFILYLYLFLKSEFDLTLGYVFAISLYSIFWPVFLLSTLLYQLKDKIVLKGNG
jgi:hypothetical protein